MSIAWLILGGLIGVVAADRKHFNMLAGGAVGALLGPFSLLMFFASGAKVRVCPFCAEKIAAEAKVCKHCRRDLPATV
ncbi:MAG: hypothetical protein ABIU84_03875 [Thermoanaerobaculia bacterium]